MKIFKCLVAAALLSVSANAVAQVVDTDNYTRIHASYVTAGISNTAFTPLPSIDPKGVSIGILQGFSLTDELPLFLEVGANLNWLHSAADVVGANVVVGDRKFTNMNFAVPINGAYKYTLNDKVAFSGHAGINLKVNMFSIDKFHYKIGGASADEKVNYLKKDDMGGRDNRGNIFQLGGQVGAGVHLADFYLGWQFQLDFMKTIEWDNGDKSRLHANYFTIGYQGEIFDF